MGRRIDMVLSIAECESSSVEVSNDHRHQPAPERVGASDEIG